METTTTNTKQHPHAELIKAWADGALIEYFDKGINDWEQTLFNQPTWDKDTKYRVKPEEPSNEPWKPKVGEQYYHIYVKLDAKIGIASSYWDEDGVDRCHYDNGNCFRTEGEAEAAAERVKAALKGDFATDNNVGSKELELDGKPLSDGEIALIKALRHAGRITDVYDYRTTVLVSANDNASGVYTHRQHIAFFTSSSDADDKLIISALKQIQTEQEAQNEAE